MIGIPVVEGANAVRHLVPDGRSGLIVEGSEGSAAGGSDAEGVMVLLPRLEPERGWDVVEIEDADTGRLATTVPSAPGEHQEARFARAKIGGMPATLLFVAHGSGAPNRPAPFTVDIYRLSTDGDDGSGRAAVFDPFRRDTTRDGFCSADAALVATENLAPAPGDATGRRDGCGISPGS